MAAIPRPQTREGAAPATEHPVVARGRRERGQSHGHITQAAPEGGRKPQGRPGDVTLCAGSRRRRAQGTSVLRLSLPQSIGRVASCASGGFSGPLFPPFSPPSRACCPAEYEQRHCDGGRLWFVRVVEPPTPFPPLYRCNEQLVVVFKPSCLGRPSASPSQTRRGWRVVRCKGGSIQSLPFPKQSNDRMTMCSCLTREAAARLTASQDGHRGDLPRR